MSQGKRPSSILLLVVLFGLLPAAFVVLVLLPTRKRMAADLARLEAADLRSRELPNIQPLTTRERRLLDDPAAPWRRRIPELATDAQRLAHYHRVVTEVQHRFKERHVLLLGIRSTWDPIQGSYTLPPTLGQMSPPGAPAPEAGKLQAWTLEVRVDGSPADLFNALEALPGIEPLLEPVALRWEADASQRKQTILLRNLVTIP